MKEKIKNFLLKIKKYFTQYFVCSRIKLILFALLCIIITAFSNLITYIANECCFNETHTEQIEETPQTEINRIDRGVNRYGYNYDDSITFGGTEFVTDSPFTNIYFNTALSGEYIHNRISNMLDLFIYDDTQGAYMYNFGHLINSSTDYYLDIILIYAIVDGLSYSILSASNETINYLLYVYPNTLDLPIGIDGFGLGFYMGPAGFSNFYYDILDNIDYVENAGFDSNNDFSWLVSRTPFTISSSGSSTPQLENAPSSLVNTIPSNAVTTLPTNLGTKVYDSGSGVTITENYIEYNTFGFQIYYESNISYSETELYRFTIDSITYDVEPNVYRYYLNDVNVVIYTLWNNTPIYYVFENLLMGGDWPFTLDYETRFNFIDLTNMFASSVSIIDTYSDYIHINIDFSYLMTLNHDSETQYLIDTDETGFEALIYSTTHSGNYADKGFDLDIIPQLDKNYSKMGVSQTNNMYSTIVYDGTINQVWSNAYHKGIGVGETNGYTNGYNDGIETGKTLQNPINPIIEFISDGALVISNVFSFEILPNVSLGTMLLFPLAIALIWFVIKLFMGG